jgi:hypothetical protein
MVLNMDDVVVVTHKFDHRLEVGLKGWVVRVVDGPLYVVKFYGCACAGRFGVEIRVSPTSIPASVEVTGSLGGVNPAEYWQSQGWPFDSGVPASP